MPEAISADVTAELLLWFYEEPRRYRAEGRRREAPVLESAVVLKLALGRRVDFAKPELRDPDIGWVTGETFLNGLNARLGSWSRGVEIRLPDAEVQHIFTCRLSAFGLVADGDRLRGLEMLHVDR